MSPTSVRRETHVCSPCIPSYTAPASHVDSLLLGEPLGLGLQGAEQGLLTKTNLSGPFFSLPGSLSSLRGKPFGGSVPAALSSGSAHGGQDLRVDCPMCLGQAFSDASWPRGSRGPGILGTMWLWTRSHRSNQWGQMASDHLCSPSRNAGERGWAGVSLRTETEFPASRWDGYSMTDLTGFKDIFRNDIAHTTEIVQPT